MMSLLINNELKEYGDKNLKTYSIHQRFESIYTIMLSYCLKCRKNTESKNLKAVRTKNRRIMLYQNVKCVINVYQIIN